MTGEFSGKVVLVTGAGRGMGRVIADAFVDSGARLVISARTRQYGEEAVEEIRSRGGEAVLVCGDLAERASVKNMIDTAIEAYGQLDVLVHCAADNAHGLVTDMDEDAFDYLVKANINSLFWIAKDAAKHLEKSEDKGRLIFISSGSANRTFVPGLIPYASTKAYMNAFARGLAVELGPRNILVNVVEPGMTASERMKTELTEEQANAIASNFAVARPGTSEDIANAVLFLASSKAGYITGTSLLVDGGASMAQLGGLSEALADG